MKLTSGRISVITLSAVAAVSLWQLRKNGQELARLREETVQLRASQLGRPAVAGHEAAPSGTADASQPASGEHRTSDDMTLADLAKLPPEERAALLKYWQDQIEKKRAAEEAAKALAERNKGPQAVSYAGGKATGPPDSAETGGDSSSAWCPAPQSSANEWLKLSYGRPVEISEIAIHETYATGALSRVVALMPNGKEKVLWEGTEPVEKPPVQRIVPVPPGVRSDQIRIELDTTRTGNWQEIDAVELVGRDGSRQWAKEAEGSSYWGGGQGITNYGRSFGLR
jgi:hypothetical protein